MPLPSSRAPRRCLLVLALACTSIPSVAHAQEPVVLPRITGEIRLDGSLDEPAWESLPPLPVVVQSPDFGEAPSLPTDIRVGYDESYLYVGGRLAATPDDVFATSFKRDLFTTASDWFGIVLDTFDDNENAVSFWTAPTGLRLDYSVFNDAQSAVQGPPPADPSWSTFWDAAVRQDSAGWYAEMRIPFSSLRFQEEDGKVTMGLIALRFIARRNEWITYPAIPPDWGFWSMAKPSKAQQVTFEGVQRRNPIYVSPYLLAGLGQNFRLDEAGSAYRREDEPTYNVGLDVKSAITDNLTLDLTANTDFAQVEADDQQVNLTRFSLFFPEKRQFFLERSSIFDFNLGGQDRLFYSRRIGLEAGEPIRILGGTRLVGRVGEWDLGVLDMQTARESGLPSENFGVLRARRQVLNDYSYAGGILTSRLNEHGGYNVNYGVDGIFRLFGDDYLSVALAQTLENGADEQDGPGGLDALRVQAQLETRKYDGLGYELRLSHAGAGYDPGIGFQLRRDYTAVGTRLFHGWIPGKRSPILRHQLAIEGEGYRRNDDRSVESAAGGVSWRGAMRRGGDFGIETVSSFEHLDAPFRLSDDVRVPEGSYTFHGVRASYGTPGGRFTRANVIATAGSFYDGTIVGATVTPRWIASRYLEVSGALQANRITFPDRAQHVDLQVARLRAQLTLDTRRSAVAFVQYNSAADAVVANVRLRYNPTEGTDLYLVYNEGLNTDRAGVIPILPLTSGRTILLKYTRTLPFGR